MISIGQWRAAIGCFCPRLNKQRCVPITRIYINSRSPGLCVRLALALSLAIIICGDVESNPGPESQSAIMKELKDLRSSIDNQFQSLKTDVVSMRKQQGKYER